MLRVLLDSGAGKGWSKQVFKKCCFFLLSACVATSGLHGQAAHTADRKADLQIGGGYSIVKSDYAPEKYKGFMFYVDLDLRQHWGIEGTFHQANEPSGGAGMYEKTYEFGPRYTRQYKDGLLRPYIKGLYGRGVYNFPKDVANLAYNLYAVGGGLDVRVNRRINVRAFDYEYQRWLGFPPNGLTPQLMSFGVAYHFGSESRYPGR